MTHQHGRTLALSTYLFIAVIGLRRSVSGWPSGTSYSSWRPGIWSNSTTCTVTAFPWNYGSSSPPGLRVKTGKKWFLSSFMKDYIISLVGHYNAFPLLCLAVCHFQKFHSVMLNKKFIVFSWTVWYGTPQFATQTAIVFSLWLFFPLLHLAVFHCDTITGLITLHLLFCWVTWAFLDGNEWSVSSFW